MTNERLVAEYVRDADKFDLQLRNQPPEFTRAMYASREGLKLKQRADALVKAGLMQRVSSVSMLEHHGGGEAITPTERPSFNTPFVATTTPAAAPVPRPELSAVLTPPTPLVRFERLGEEAQHHPLPAITKHLTEILIETLPAGAAQDKVAQRYMLQIARVAAINMKTGRSRGGASAVIDAWKQVAAAAA